MQNVVFTQLSLPEFRKLIREEISEAIQDTPVKETIVKPQKEIFGIEEAVKLLGIAKPTLYTKTSKGEIPHFKKGKKLYFRHSELMAWIEGDRRKTVAAEKKEVEDYLMAKEKGGRK